MSLEWIECDNIFDILIVCYDNVIKRKIDVLTEWTLHEKQFEEIVEEFMRFFRSIKYEDLFDSENKLKLIDKITEMESEYKDLSNFGLMVSINNSFGNRNDNYYIDEDSETDGELVSEQISLNSEKTFHLGRVFYRAEESIFNRLLSELDYPRTDEGKGYSIDCFLDNLLVIRTLETEIKMKYHQLISEYTLDCIEKHKDDLNVALVPFVGNLKYLNKKDDGKIFTINIEDDDQNFNHLKEILNELNKRSINIVIFPEMTFTTKMELELEKHLLNNKTSFVLIVSGSTWENRTNKCKIYNGKGQMLMEQIKISPYSIVSDPKRQIDGNTEGISLTSDQAMINILDIKNIGRLAMPICLDFTEKEYFIKLETGGVNITFNPVCTSSLTDFATHSKALGAANKGTVFISNSCMHRKSDKIGFVYLPMKIDKKIKPLCEEDLSYNRTKECKQCIEECINKICFKSIKFSCGHCVTERVRL